MTLSTQRTLFNTDLHLAMLFGSSYACLPHTTLNERFGINSVNENGDVAVKDSGYPTIQYLCIGVGGNPGINDSKGFIHSEHSPLDASLFTPIPFLMLEGEPGSVVDDRIKNYAFAKTEHLSNGKTYTSYYLRKIENVNNIYDNKFQRIKNVGSETFISTLDTNIDMLTPKPRSRKLDFKTIAETEFITKLCKMKITFSQQEVRDLYNVYKIRGIESNMLTEMGICSARKVMKAGTDSELEPADVQIMFFLDLNLDLTTSFNTGAGFTKYIEIGGAEPYIEGTTSEAD